jgi:Myotubularin-like phosphatase domain
MINEVSKVNENYVMLSILDCRPYLNAMGNKLKGGGFESSSHYKNTKFSFCGIENIHYVSKSFEKMFAIA